MIKPEEVTIIVPTLNRGKEIKFSLLYCLESLNETAPSIKKIIAINGTVEDLDEEADTFPTMADSFISLTEQGQCKATNAAVATTNTPWIFVTNDDMVYPEGWFDKLAYWTEVPKLQCVSPKLVEPRSGAPTFLVEFCGGAGGDFDKRKFTEFVKNSKKPERLDSGFNLPFLIKRELWDLIGGYDINYDPWGSNSDSDLEYKIKSAGVDMWQAQNCLVYHFSQTSGTFEPKNDSHRFKNYAYFKEKWGFDRTDNGIWEATFNIPTKEEGRKFNPTWENYYGSK